jgi:hypothetical protein
MGSDLAQQACIPDDALTCGAVGVIHARASAFVTDIQNIATVNVGNKEMYQATDPANKFTAPCKITTNRG